MTVTEDLFGYTDTCTGTFTVEVFELGYPNTGGEGTCAWAGSLGIFSTPTLTFGGDLEEPDWTFDTPGVTFSVLENDLWTGANAWADASTETIWGEFSGDDIVTYSGFGVMLEFDGTFEVSR